MVSTQAERIAEAEGAVVGTARAIVSNVTAESHPSVINLALRRLREALEQLDQAREEGWQDDK